MKKVYIVCTWDEVDCENVCFNGSRSLDYAYLNKDKAEEKAKQLYSGHIVEMILEG